MIIPTYNRARLLRYTLESLVQQTLPRDRFEVIVVDDGSSDATAAMVEGFRGRLDLRYFFQEDDGYRVAAARNVGVAHATGDVCVFLDSGVLAHSTCLAAHVAAHERAPGPAAVTGYVYCFNLGNEDAAEMERVIDLTDPDATIGLLREQKRWLDLREGFYTEHDDDLRSLPAPWLMYWTCNASARTGQIREIGGFDEAFRRWGGEDIDLGYRLHRDGADFLIERAAAAIHYPHPKNAEDNTASTATGFEYIAAKYATPITRLLLEVDEIGYGELNNAIIERGLPDCADYLAGKRAGG